jgi:hypothetical protein
MISCNPGKVSGDHFAQFFDVLLAVTLQHPLVIWPNFDQGMANRTNVSQQRRKRHSLRSQVLQSRLERGASFTVAHLCGLLQGHSQGDMRQDAPTCQSNQVRQCPAHLLKRGSVIQALLRSDGVSKKCFGNWLRAFECKRVLVTRA